jgi:hypothetical protein
LKYLLSKKDAKSRLIWWILLLQEFDIEIWDRKDFENLVANHLSLLIVDYNEDTLPIAKTFPNEQLMHVPQIYTTWFADIVNYLVTGQMHAHWTKQDRLKLLAKVKHFLWDNPYLFKYCPDQIIRRCIPENDQSSVISAEAILVLARPLQRFYNVDSIGLPFFVTPTLIVQLVSGAKS